MKMSTVPKKDSIDLPNNIKLTIENGTWLKDYFSDFRRGTEQGENA